MISKLKLAFIIDKTQTFQIIANQLFESLNRGHECTLFCVFPPNNLGRFLSDASLTCGVDIEKALSSNQLKWEHNVNRNVIIKKLVKQRHLYDAVLGINLFNKSLSSIYDNKDVRSYAFEYCWNEVYNQRSDLGSGSKLFCNSEITKKMIQDLSGFTDIECLGSPWFELLSQQKEKSKDLRLITVLQPHNSFYAKDKNLLKKFEHFITNLRSWCDKHNYDLALKSRSKYRHNYEKVVNFDRYVSDDDAFTHIDLYSNSSVVLHFCSSAINELTFLETPYVAIAPELQENLHTDMSCDAGIKELHQKYYSGAIFDDIHCSQLVMDDVTNYETIDRTISSLVNGKKDWKKFQKSHFPGTHALSTKEIIDYIEKENEKN